MGRTTKIFCLLRCVCISLTLVVVGMSNSAYAQQFRLVEDTVLINASDFISPVSTFYMKWAAKYHGYYFCIFKEQQLYGSGRDKHRLLVISEDEKNVVEVKLPDDFNNNSYGDIFVRHNTLYLRPSYHNEQSGYYFDMRVWKWKPVRVIPNIIYDDDQYSIAYIDIGEWGYYTWFIEKNVSNVYIQKNSMSSIISDIRDNTTSVRIKPFNTEVKDVCNQYIMYRKLSRIIKKDSVYYFIGRGRVDTLISLNGKAQLCEYGDKYEDAAFHQRTFISNVYNSHQKLEPIPTLFAFTSNDEDELWFKEKAYDTVFKNAFLTNDDIYYLVNTKNKTYIAQLKDGILQEKFDFGRQYSFYEWYDCYRGVNFAPNQCFNKFKENQNSYGILEIKDTIIHVFHIIHNQDSLSYLGTDNIEPRLKFLLDHLENLKFSKIDSVEKSLRATGQGEFGDLANNYYPDKYQTGKYERYSYYTVIDSKKTLSVDYCVHKSDSVVRGAFFNWRITNYYNSYSQVWKYIDVEQKFEEIRQILTRLTGEAPVTSYSGAGKIQYLEWNYNHVKVQLYVSGRMVMYLTDN